MAAWQQAERQLREQASTAAPAGMDAMRKLLDYGGDYAGFAREAWRLFEPGRAPGEEIIDQYRRLFMPAAAFAVPGPDASAPAAALRWQAATQRLSQQVAAIAADASRRLAAALDDDGPDAPPITSLRQLHDLWVECGEAAYAEAAHGEAFAAAQAEWLAAAVELYCHGRGAGR
jgi:hypothetical protein